MYRTFAKLKEETTGARRVVNILNARMAVEDLIRDYEDRLRSLLQWARQKTQDLSQRDFPNSLTGVQEEMQKLKSFRTDEKPPK